jgi:dTDP-4-dehydrorhamnose 3,5-epimerase
MDLNFKRLVIPDVILIEAQAVADHRGFFSERFKRSIFAANGIPVSLVQVNHSYSRPRVLRGLHYQNPPKAAGKLVGAIRGEIFDVAVDIRKGSPTYGRAVTARLTGSNRLMLWVPRGFAHGFCALGHDAEVIYQMDEEYAPEVDRGILWNDPAIGVEWPIDDPVLSEKDANLPLLSAADNHFFYQAPATEHAGVRTDFGSGGQR